MRGVLFRNKDKASDKHPDYKGQCEIDGKQCWVDAWIKTPKAGGDKFMSLSFKFKTAQQGGSGNQSARQPARNDFDDEPF
jgi:hypothetical protein